MTRDDDFDAPVTGKDILECLRDAGDEQVQETLRRGGLAMTPTDQVDSVRPWVDRILRANGIGVGAYISNESTMWDLMPFEADERLKVIQARLGIEFELNEHIHEVAARLRDAEQALDN